MITTLLISGAALGQAPSSPTPPHKPLLVHGYVYFEEGSAVPNRRGGIDPIAYLGSRIPDDAYVHVRGQTDTAGTDEYNLDLSKQRARAVADLLIAEGNARADRVTLFVCGERILNRPTPDGVAEPLNRFAYFDWNAEPPRTQEPHCFSEPYVSVR